jgi:xanthine dehydrogenase accessory factor
VSRPGAVYAELSGRLREGAPVALATVTELAPHPEPGPEAGGEPGAESGADLPVRLGGKLLVAPPDVLVGSLGSEDLDRVVERDARAALERGTTVTRHYGARGEARRRDVTVFIEVFAPPPRLVIFGAVDFTAALANVGRLLGFHVTVCDARPVFATAARFPMAHEVVVDWPDRYLAKIASELGPRDAVCVLTHDTKFDVPAILSALETDVGYLGAMGSRRTHEERWRRLLEAGADGEVLEARLMSPIGLDIGARTPEETAVAIAAEIIAYRAGVATPSLRHAAGPIHRR